MLGLVTEILHKLWKKIKTSVNKLEITVNLFALVTGAIATGSVK